jgi:mannitol-1-phosphate 5-dehydrogenase
LVLFGAGKIGRSFIGQLFSNGGYEVVFIDTNKALIDALNYCGHYKVIIKSEKEEILDIKNVRGAYADDKQRVTNEIATAGILAVSVGLEGLDQIFPVLADGLIKRQAIDNTSALDIIIAENMRNADTYFKQSLEKLLPLNYPFDRLVGLVETSIGKMVPIMQKKDLQEDILQVFAEPYNTLILNKKGFKNPIPAIKGLSPEENMKAWVDRKLFIHNLGHSAAAYLGYVHNPGFIYLYEVLAVAEIYKEVRDTMLQSADILLKKYPGEFTPIQLEEHIDDLLLRFQNKALGDTIFRVGCDLLRKLGPQDRLAGAIKSAQELKLRYNKILYALVCGFHFRAKDEAGKMLKGDLEFIELYRKGINHILTVLCGFNESENSQLYKEAVMIDSELGNTINTSERNAHSGL